MLEELLGANEAILKALEMYDAVESGKEISQNVGLLFDYAAMHSLQ